MSQIGYQITTNSVLLGNSSNSNIMWVWGDNSNGQYGNGTTGSVNNSPVQTVTGNANDWSSITMGAFSTAAIKTNGTLWTWGNNVSGQLGNSTINSVYSPIQTIALGTNWKQVAFGRYAISAIKTDGTLWTWGGNLYGELGDSTKTSRSSPIQTITLGNNWKQASCGYLHMAAVKTDGTLWAWGYNNYGGLGDSTTISRSSPVQTIALGTNWSQVSVGRYFFAAVKTDGTLWTCGYNSVGQLGDNTRTNRSSPVQTIALGTNWTVVTSGSSITAGIKTDGTLWNWGIYAGEGTNTRRSSPVQTSAGGTNWSTVTGTNSGYIGLKTDGTLWTWGAASPQQLIMTPQTWLTVISESSQTATFAALTATYTPNSYQYSTSDLGDLLVPREFFSEGGLWSCGYNVFGALGNSTSTNRSSPVQTIAGGANWKQVACGYVTAAIKTDGTLWSWGLNNGGNVGDNTRTSRSSPVQTVALGNNWKQVACGQGLTVAIKTNGTLWNWGDNGNGTLGDSTTITRSSPVQTIALGNNWRQASGGRVNTAAIKTDGTLWMWGLNSNGQLGDSTTIARSSPIQTIALGNDWKQVACGNSVLAIKTDGTLWTCGYNTQGQLGDSTTVKRSSPVQTIALGNNWKQVAKGYLHCAGVKTNGTLWLWGYNVYGQLGDSTVDDKSSPVQTIALGNNWKQVACGDYHTAAIKTDGTVWLWGRNIFGQLGNSTTTDSSSPIQTIALGSNWKQVACGYRHTSIVKDDIS